MAGTEINIIMFAKNGGYDDMPQFFVGKLRFYMRFSLFLAFSIDFLGPTAGRDQDWRHDQFQDMDRPRVSRAGLERTWAELCLELLQAERKGNIGNMPNLSGCQGLLS